MLNRDQLTYLLGEAKKSYKGIFGQEVSNEQLLEVINKELEKRQVGVIMNRLCNQRADRDLILMKEIIAPDSTPVAVALEKEYGKPPKKPVPGGKMKFSPDPMNYEEADKEAGKATK